MVKVRLRRNMNFIKILKLIDLNYYCEVEYNIRDNTNNRKKNIHLTKRSKFWRSLH